ncbi:MAG: hypothetical protein K6T55_12635 [Syntrophobacterales bacterium]|nr:hypothetical protein [Syntrophobacterales bacterium]
MLEAFNSTVEQVLLAAALLFGAGLGFGGAAGKGWLFLEGLRRKNGNNGDQKQRLAYQDYLSNLLPCKDHSGLVTDVKHLLRGTEEIKATLGELWNAVNELRKEVRNR